MRLKIKGIIHNVELKNKLIGIRQNKKISFFYFQNSQLNLFRRYLYKGNWIELEFDEDSTVKRGNKEAYTISFVYKISAIDKYDQVIYYDKKQLNQSVSKFLKSLGNIMFLDLEMTMPSYTFKGKGFTPELLQAGFIIQNNEGEELSRYSNYVMPKLTPNLSKRAENFLSITNLEFQAKAISYKEFYNDFTEALEEFNPAIVVYGRNDILVLNESYNINGMPSLKSKTRFINLCQLIKNHYDLRNDPGLFKLYKIYYENEDIQTHDAFSDSFVTAKVFKAFKDEVNLKTDKAEILRRELD